MNGTLKQGRSLAILSLFVVQLASLLVPSRSNAQSVYIIPDVDSLYVCEGTTFDLNATAADSYAWSPGEDFDDSASRMVVVSPSTSRWYYLAATLGGVTYVDSIYISVLDPQLDISLSNTDTVCPATPVAVQFNASAPIVGVSWSPDNGVDEPDNLSGSVIRPLETTEYIVTVDLGTCNASDTFTIDVIPFILRNERDEDTVFLCKPDTGIIRLRVQPPDLDITWAPLDPFIDISLAQNGLARVYPEITSTYTASATFEQCSLTVTTVVKVDSLPDDLTITIFNPKDPFCSGDSIYIIGTNVDTSKYPDLEFIWMPAGDGQIQPPFDAGNVRVTLLDTTTFVRTLENNACRDSSTVTVNVIPPDIPLSVNDTMLCPGKTFKVEVLDKEVEDLQWMPEEGLSCTECFEPTVTVLNMPMMYSVSGMKEGCPVGSQLNVTPLTPVPIPVSPPVAAGCEGDEVQLAIDTTGLMNLRLAVISGDVGLSCTDCPDPVVTITGSGVIGIAADVPDSIGCGAFRQVPVGIGAPEAISFTEFLCPDEPTTIDLTVFGFVNPDVDLNGIGDCNGSIDCLMPVITIGNNSGQITITSDNSSPGFCGTVTTIIFQPLPPDNANIVALDSTPYGRGQILTLEVQPPAPAGTDYAWISNGAPVDAMGPQAMVELTQSGINEVGVTFTNNSGCLQTLTAAFFAEEPEINVPNAFTPNGDDTNDNFRVQIVGGAEIDEMLIFNRWGQVVYQGKDPEGWDGTYNGEPAPPEVYAYLIRIRLPSGDIGELKGDVTLIR